MAERVIYCNDFNVTGTERKKLVKIISDFVQDDARYLGAPSFAYEVDGFTINKNGTVSYDSRIDDDEVKNPLEALEEQGYKPTSTHLEVRDVPEDGEDSELPFDVQMGSDVISVPRDSVSLKNLTKLLQSKGKLIRKAVGKSSLTVYVEEDKVAFPWFTLSKDGSELSAYAHFISALCKMSIEQKRVTAVERPVENEKYAFRCFLLRLGFIGAEYKQERKILLSNLSGNGSYRSGAPTSAEGGDNDDE